MQVLLIPIRDLCYTLAAVLTVLPLQAHFQFRIPDIASSFSIL